jgi:hypothetical protein
MRLPFGAWGFFIVDFTAYFYTFVYMKTLLKIISKTQFGFVTKEDLDTLEVEMPNLPLLIRCGRDRCIAQAQDTKARMDHVEETGDYVRDVSIPARILDEMSKSPFIPFTVKQAIEGMRA